MPDRENVFDALRNCITEPKCRNCPWEDCERFECKRTDIPISLGLDILKLLKEQEAVEPYQFEDVWKCGNCGDGVVAYEELGVSGIEEVKFDYCPTCGRRVLWEGR